MRRGENIYRRKDGRWEGRYRKGRKANGQVKYGYVYGRSLQEVRMKLYPLKVRYQSIQNTQESCVSHCRSGGINGCCKSNPASSLLHLPITNTN